MSDAIAFLHALAQALSTMALYTPGHPAAKRASENLWLAVTRLLAADQHPVFLFLGTAPVYNGRALQELRDWLHSRRLAAAGVQRVEFASNVTPEALDELLGRIVARLAGDALPASEPDLVGITFGSVAVEGTDDTAEYPVVDEAPLTEADLQLDLQDELDAMRFVLREAAAGRIARAEVDALGHVLNGLVEQLRLPQIAYSVAPGPPLAEQAINTAFVTIAAAAMAGIDAAGRHRAGVAALLHHVGMVRVPADQVAMHPEAGATLLLSAGGPGLELAAVVAREHHWRPDGAGYPPEMVMPHWMSRLVAATAAFVRLRTPVDGQSALSVDSALDYLERGTGREFDPEMVALVASAARPL